MNGAVIETCVLPVGTTVTRTVSLADRPSGDDVVSKNAYVSPTIIALAGIVKELSLVDVAMNKPLALATPNIPQSAPKLSIDSIEQDHCVILGKNRKVG